MLFSKLTNMNNNFQCYETEICNDISCHLQRKLNQYRFNGVWCDRQNRLIAPMGNLNQGKRFLDCVAIYVEAVFHGFEKRLRNTEIVSSQYSKNGGEIVLTFQCEIAFESFEYRANVILGWGFWFKVVYR